MTNFMDLNTASRRVLVIASCIIGLMALRLPAGQAQTSTAPAKLPLTPCHTPDGKQDALCGTLEVPENRAVKNGRRIPLNVLVLPARAKTPQPDPLFAIAGGPGQSSVDAFSGTPSPGYIDLIRNDRAVVLVDQRGTGKSNPLECNFHGDSNSLQGWFDMPYTPEKMRQCRDQITPRADPAQYTTTEAAHDMDDVRRALGYDKINILGGSYGTTAALVYLREHGQAVRSAILKGVFPPEARLPLSFPKTVQQATDRVFANCAAEDRCHASFPHIQEEFVELLKKLDHQPATFRMKNPKTNQEEQVTLTREMFVEFLRPMLYIPQVVSAFPYLIHSAAQGEFVPFANVNYQITPQLEKLIARGMSFSVICSESVPFITEGDIRPTLTTYTGDIRIRRYQKACAEWPAAKLPKQFLDPVQSNAPVLLISGDLDPATPPELARDAARKLSNSRVISVKGGTHLTVSPCLDKMIGDFVTRASSKNLDTGCIDEIKPPQFMGLPGQGGK